MQVGLIFMSGITILRKIFVQFSGRISKRIRFGCAPKQYENQAPGEWISTHYKTIIGPIQVYVCNAHLCNSPDIINGPTTITATMSPATYYNNGLRLDWDHLFLIPILASIALL